MTTEIAKLDEAKQKFELACNQASNMAIVQNAGAAFEAVVIVNNLKEALTDEVMKKVFMPLMNTKIGFLTDRTGKKTARGEAKPLYSVDVVRDCIIDAASFGLLPTFNQFNIIADRMYPTKEGYTALLKKAGVKYVLSFGKDTSPKDAAFAEISVKINFTEKGQEPNSMVMMAVVAKNQYSSYDQIKGKAERRAKKQLFEYVTGNDLGDGDAGDDDNAQVIDVTPEPQSEKTTPKRGDISQV